MFERVFVTGGSGRLGRYVVDELSRYCRVTVLDRVRPEEKQPYAEVDILDLERVSSVLRGADAVIHLAALDASVNASEPSFFEVNVQGTWNVLYAALEAGVRRAVICSSTSVTGLDFSNPTMPPLYLPVDEEHPLRPSRAYGLSKQVGEVVARSFARRGIDVSCLRFPYIVFPELVSQVDRAVNPEPVFDEDDGLEPMPLLRSYVEPEDAARSFRLALEVAHDGFDVFYVTAPDICVTVPTLEHIRNVYGSVPPVRRREVYEANPEAAVFDGTRARERLGFVPQSNWRKLLRSS